MEAGLAERLGRIPVPVISSGPEPEAADTEADAEPESAADTDSYESAPVGPSEGEEAVFIETDIGYTHAAVVTEAVETEEAVELPALEELVKRIPAEALTAMDELFRAKFVRVRQIPKKNLNKS